MEDTLVSYDAFLKNLAFLAQPYINCININIINAHMWLLVNQIRYSLGIFQTHSYLFKEFFSFFEDRYLAR